MLIETKTGFKFELADKTLDDMRLVQEVSLLQKGKTDYAIPILVRLLGGDENFDHLLTHLEGLSEDGIAHSSALLTELTDILNCLGEGGKKSSPSPTSSKKRKTS